LARFGGALAAAERQSVERLAVNILLGQCLASAILLCIQTDVSLGTVSGSNVAMTDTLAQVRAAYDRYPEREWQRLESGAQARLEYLITTHALQQHLPSPDPTCHLLDAGGGPGRYTLALAARGYFLTLLDLSPALLSIARQQIADAPLLIQQHIQAIEEGSITDLSRFRDQQFDAVLCLGGPLSHILDESERQRALHELGRVARRGAPLFISVMNRLGSYCSTIQWQTYARFSRQFARTGIGTIGPADAPAYFYLPEEFLSSLETAGLRVIRVYGCNGLGAHLEEQHLLALMADPKHWPEWRELLLATADQSTIIGVSNHLLAVAQRVEVV
jgi:SAM-dependent methyltransferase